MRRIIRDTVDVSGVEKRDGMKKTLIETGCFYKRCWITS